MEHIRWIGPHTYEFDFTKVNDQQAQWRAENLWKPVDPNNPFAAPGSCLDDADCFDYGIPCGY